MTSAVPTGLQIGMASGYFSLKVQWFGPPERDLKQRVLCEGNVASLNCVVIFKSCVMQCSQRNMIKFAF